MYRQLLTMLFRRFSKNPVFSFITLANLTIGFATFILLSQFVKGLMSWDKQNENYERIYRVQLFQDQKDNAQTHSSSITAALSRHNLPGLPEIEKVVLMHDVGDNNKNGVFLSADKKNQLLVRYGYYADESVFDIFTFRFVEGDPHNALIGPFSIVLSQTLADKLFPKGGAIGQQLYGENKVAFTVTGVYEDIPDRSSWIPAYLIPMKSYTALTGFEGYEDNYWAYSFYTYVLLKPQADPARVDEKIHYALKEYRKEHIPYLRPMKFLNLNPYFQKDWYIMLILLAFTALLILVLSSINYINLQTANATTRFREIGIRKTVGFSKRRLLTQFLFESVSLAFLGGILGLILAQMATPAFNRMIESEILTGIIHDWKLALLVLAIALLAGFLSGIHPAFAISRFNPVTALKQKLISQPANGISLKKILVTAQFSISIFLLATGFIIYRQSQYIIKKDMGFDSHNILFANVITDKKGSFDMLRQRLISHPEIADACQSDYIPFVLPGGDELSWDEADPETKVFVRFYKVSYDYIPTYNMKLVTGRNFSREFQADHEKCIINQTAARIFGWGDTLGKSIKIYDRNYEVIGIIEDHVAFSVHNPIEPELYRLIPDSITNDRMYSLRFMPGMEKQAFELALQEFKEYFPDDAFELKNIRSRILIEGAANAWKQLTRVSVFFAFVSVIISSIGLFGLILFYTRSKLKEIGIRKVLGFTSGQLYFGMSFEFMQLLLIAIVIACPAAYFVYDALPGADKYPLQAWEFIIAALITIVVALGTISYQIIKALKVRPVEILKDE